MHLAPRRIGALVRLSWAEGVFLLWPWGAVAVLVVASLACLTDYLSPPFWFVERGELAASQGGAAVVLVMSCLLLGWVWARHRGLRSDWLARVDSSPGVIGAEAIGLAAATLCASLAAAVASYPSLIQYGLPHTSSRAGATALSFLGLAALAPGLARLPVTKPHLVLACGALLAGQLGFLSPVFPLRTARLWTRPEPIFTIQPRAAAPDVLVALAGLFVSFGVARTVRRGS